MNMIWRLSNFYSFWYWITVGTAVDLYVSKMSIFARKQYYLKRFPFFNKLEICFEYRPVFTWRSERFDSTFFADLHLKAVTTAVTKFRKISVVELGRKLV